jgi:phosphohistidine phosphatase
MEPILWRHADAEPGRPDLERKLTPEGRKQAQRAAEWLRDRLPADARVLVSPARRALETAEALTRSFRTEPALAPDVPAAQVLAAAGWPDATGTVVVVGPGARGRGRRLGREERRALVARFPQRPRRPAARRRVAGARVTVRATS